MKKVVWIGLAVFAIILFIANNTKKDPEKRTYESSYNSTSTMTESEKDRSYVGNSLNTGSVPYKSKEPSVEDDPYYNNSLRTGSSPYTNNSSSVENESNICVRTSSNSNCDVVVIVKRGDVIARNAYIKAGGSHTFYLSNGTYQVFFYGGKGWNPNKAMPNGLQGGFVANESYSKDYPVSLEYQSLTYELIPQPNGNFSTAQSSAEEIF